MTEEPDKPNLEERKQLFEERKWEDERRLREKGSDWTTRFSPLLVTVVTGVIAFASIGNWNFNTGSKYW